MSAEYTFDVAVVYNPLTDDIVVGASGDFLDVLGGSAQPIYDMNASPIASVVSNENGITQRFRADIPYGYLSFGGVALPIFSMEAIAAAVAAAGLVAVANQAAADAAAAEASAAAAAAAAQAALAAIQQGGGLNQSALDTYMGGSAATLIDRMMMPWLRTNGGTGAWDVRPDCLVAVAIGTSPPPTGLSVPDVYLPYS